MTTFRFPKTGGTVRAEAETLLPLTVNTWPDPMYGMTVNTRIHPRGRPCTWYVEVGPPGGEKGDYVSEGSFTTDARSLPGKLNAFFAEPFSDGQITSVSVADDSVDGFMTNNDAGHYVSWDASEGGFAHWDIGDAFPDSYCPTDDNHVDGVGYVQIGLNAPYGNNWDLGDLGQYFLSLGGHRFDLRGAKISMRMRVDPVRQGPVLERVRQRYTAQGASELGLSPGRWIGQGGRHRCVDGWRLARCFYHHAQQREHVEVRKSQQLQAVANGIRLW